MIVLDTHAWLWWQSESSRLSAGARRAIARADQIGVSAISCWEFAMLVAKGRIAVDRAPLAWIEQALAAPRVELLPLTPAVAVKATELDGFHGDPADRLIVATALIEGAPVITADDRIRKFSGVIAIWRGTRAPCPARRGRKGGAGLPTCRHILVCAPDITRRFARLMS